MGSDSTVTPKKAEKTGPYVLQDTGPKPHLPASPGGGVGEQKQLPETMRGKPSLLPTPARCRTYRVVQSRNGLCRQCRPARRPGPSGSGPAGAPQLFDSEGAGPGGAASARGQRRPRLRNSRVRTWRPQACPVPFLIGQLPESPPLHWSGSDGSLRSRFRLF